MAKCPGPFLHAMHGTEREVGKARMDMVEGREFSTEMIFLPAVVQKLTFVLVRGTMILATRGEAGTLVDTLAQAACTQMQGGHLKHAHTTC